MGIDFAETSKHKINKEKYNKNFAKIDWGRKEKTQDIEFWDCEDAEVLYYEDKNEAIEKILDGVHPDVFPSEIEICGYVKRTINCSISNRADSVLESILEGLDEEYGNPEDSTEPCKDMIKTTNEFVSKIFSLYNVWQCDIVVREKINTEKWVKGNAPEWIEEQKLKFK
ncbi:MAG: hypothetical protein ACTSU6_04765 [Candidatus Njordarchaeales archaeon]